MAIGEELDELHFGMDSHSDSSFEREQKDADQGFSNLELPKSNPVIKINSNKIVKKKEMLGTKLNLDILTDRNSHLNHEEG